MTIPTSSPAKTPSPPPDTILQQPSSSGSCVPSALPLRQKSDSESSEGSCEGVGSLDKLLTMFCGKLSAKRVCAVYHAFKDDFHASVECLLGKVDLQRIVGHLNRYYSEQPVHKIKIDDDDVWQDMIVVYKARQLDVSKQVRICVQNQPAVDTGGVRRQVYSLVYDEFLLNKH